MDINPTIEALRSSPERFRDAIQSIPAEALRWSDGGWSITAILTHLAFSEVFYGERFRYMVQHNNQPIFIFTSERVPVGGHPNIAADELMRRWQKERAELCRWLTTLLRTDWESVAIHPERQQVTLLDEARSMLAHDDEHLAQVMQVYNAWQARFQSRRSV